MPNAYLAHYGAKGQHWGVRRYQNSDGSLTPLGRVHYGVGEARKATSRVVKAVASKTSSTAKAAGTAVRKVVKPTDEELDARIAKQKEKNNYAAKRRELRRLKKTGVNDPTTDPDGKSDKGQHKRFSEMSDQEINARIARLQKEVTLADLERKKDMGPVRRMVDEALMAAGKTAVQSVATGVGKELGAKFVDGLLGTSVASKSNDDTGGKKSKSNNSNTNNNNSNANSSDRGNSSPLSAHSRSERSLKKSALKLETQRNFDQAEQNLQEAREIQQRRRERRRSQN